MSNRSLEKAHREIVYSVVWGIYTATILRHLTTTPLPQSHYSGAVLALSDKISLVLSDALTVLQPDLKGGFQASSEGQHNYF